MKRTKRIMHLILAIAIICNICSPFALAASTQTNYGVAKIPVAGNASVSPSPKVITTASGGDVVHPFFQVDSSQKLKQIVFKAVDPGSSSTKTLETFTFTNYGRYADTRYILPNVTGTFKVSVVVTYTNGSKKTFTCPYVKVTKSSAGAGTTTTKTYTIDANSIEDFIQKAQVADRSAIGFSSFRYTVQGDQIYTGKVIVKKTVLSWKTISVKVPALYGPNPPTKTIKLKMPYEVKYTLHKHSYDLKANTRSVCNFVVGLFYQVFDVTFTCSCGASYDTYWEIPDLTFDKVTGGSTYQITTTSRTKA